MNRIWTTYEQNMNNLWTEYEQTMNRIWTIYEQNMNKLWTEYEQTMNRLYMNTFENSMPSPSCQDTVQLQQSFSEKYRTMTLVACNARSLGLDHVTGRSNSSSSCSPFDEINKCWEWSWALLVCESSPAWHFTPLNMPTPAPHILNTHTHCRHTKKECSSVHVSSKIV
jgi:hypothetical protein